ncbi:hypothetical protein CMI37_21755 [Candidatus Pacearchaeota archaeon]|nr:hypothetical protein [Candidatus Pacearchaeota archaeon]|tara:strand:- start:753 stop:1115 length:363 start_codon:yes stop_codon:yes gene_type:complete
MAIRETSSIRYRINVSTSTKGIQTFECTVDAEGFEMDDVLDMSDSLVDELTKRYPPVPSTEASEQQDRRDEIAAAEMVTAEEQVLAEAAKEALQVTGIEPGADPVATGANERREKDAREV